LHQRHAEIVVRPDVLRVERDRPLELFDGVIELAAVFVQKAEVIVHFRTRVVLLEQHTIMRERAVEVAHAVVVERQSEMVLRRRRGKRRNRRHRNRFWNSLRRRRAR